MKIMVRKSKLITPDIQHTRHSRVIIDLEAIRLNYQFLKSTAANSKVIAVIKADAYGHGAIQVAKTLVDADAFAVATVMEAIELRDAGIQQKIIILGGVVSEVEMQACFEYRLDPVIHQFWQIDLLKKAEHTGSIDTWLKFNSGMGRLGFSTADIKLALEQVTKLSLAGTIRLMTHLANADDTSDQASTQQISRAKSLGLEKYEWGIANSAGILGWPQSRLNWVRAGIALYGSDPLLDHSATGKLKPVMQFKSQVLAINHLKKGQSIGYGGLYTCPQDQTIAVVAAGYADGYPRHLKNAYVLVNEQKVPIVGRVSMDMITINITDLDVKAGDEVTLWGNSPLANEIAELSETISYELFCHAGCHGKKEFINKT
ncbi:MAG: alanine racemase [Gammaproteobacteria bacterium]|nr:alanine racemase [Gammaproteobacteria bacterium]